MKSVWTVMAFLLLWTFSAAAQESVIVPDLRGMNLPRAAATLNELGLQLGAQNAEGWTAASGLEQNTVAAQSVAAGAAVAPGSAVDVTVLRSANMRLIYDDNDITVVNLTSTPMNVSGLIFTVTEGSSATYAASQWANDLRENQCFQLWSVNRNGPKDVPGCQFIQTWRTTTNTGSHFWTQSSGAQRFRVLENGVERATCDAAGAATQNSPISCEFFVAGGGAGDDSAPFIYLAYNEQAVAFINPTEDQWMVTNQTTILNFNPSISVPGASLIFSDPALLREEFRTGAGNFALLAPQQCIMFTVSGTAGEAPRPCDVIASRDLGANVAFWLANFTIRSSSDGLERSCPAATPGRTTLCIVPR